MPRMSFSEMLVMHPEKAAQKLAYHRKRIVLLTARPSLARPHERVDEHQRAVARYEQAFRETARCEDCGHKLEDPDSVKRGVGPDCWAKRHTGNTAAPSDADIADLLERAKTFDEEVGF